MEKPRVVIMAGGTGGHIFPALAVARRLQSQGWEVQWLGTESGLEADIIPKAGFPLHYISVKGLRKKGAVALLVAPFQLCLALFQAWRVLTTLKPRVVLGMGGFASGPGGLAAWLSRIPLVIHEQNAIAGFTNRCLARLATRVLEAFPNTFSPSIQAICTGNPVREELFTLPSPNERFCERTGALRLLVIGGSRGAAALNQLCPAAMQKIARSERPEILHQAGSNQADATLEAYKTAGVEARVQPFIDDMASAYAWADLVLCRSGALTIAELATVGIGSILVPFPHAVDDHQTSNGRFLETRNAAILIQQSDLDPQTLADIVLKLSNDRPCLLAMANAAYQSACRDALTRVSTYCEEIGNHGFNKS